MFMLSKLSVEDLKFRISELEASGSINSEMVYICNLLSEKLRYNNVNLTHSLTYANKAKNYAFDLNYKEGQAYSFAQIGHTYFHLDKLPESEENLRASIKLFEELKNKRGLAFALNGLIWILIDLGNFAEATEKIKRVFEIVIELGDDKEKIKIFDNISKLCFYFQNYDIPLEFQHEIISIKKAHLNYGRFYDHIGLLYFMKGDNQKSLENFEKAIFESQLNEDKLAIAKIYSNFSNVYYRLGENEKASEHFQKSALMIEEMGLDHTKLSVLESIVTSSLQMEDYKNALIYINELIDLTSDEKNNYLHLQAKTDKAHAKYMLGEIDEAHSLLLNVLEKFEKDEYVNLQYKCHEILVKIYESKNNTEKALKHFKLFDKYRGKNLLERSLILKTIRDIQTQVKEMKFEEKYLKIKNVEVAKAYDELANQNEELHQVNKDNLELLNRINRLKELLPVCDTCKEKLNHPNYLDALENSFNEKPDSYKKDFGCLSCIPTGNKKTDHLKTNKPNYIF